MILKSFLFLILLASSCILHKREGDDDDVVPTFVIFIQLSFGFDMETFSEVVINRSVVRII